MKRIDLCRKSVMTYGALVWDIINGEEYIGGAPFNTSVHLARLGIDVSFVSRIGNDRLGKKALEAAKGLSIDTSNIQIDSEHETGYAYCKIKEDGSAEYCLPEEPAYQYIENLSKVRNNKKYNAFYFGSWEQKGRISQETLGQILESYKFEEVFFDINIRKDFYPKDIVEYSLSKATIAKMNEEEAEKIACLLYGEFGGLCDFSKKIAADYNLRIVCITKGKDGHDILFEGKYEKFPTEKIKVCDTIGAGDAFSAAFLAFYLKTEDPYQAGRMAEYLGGYVASQKSALPEYSDNLKHNLSIN